MRRVMGKLERNGDIRKGADDMHLATFVHISDLHIADIDPNTGRTTDEAGAALIWATLGWFDGLLGHSTRALERLEQFFHQIQRQENASLIVSGDLTRVGKQEQFDTASEYLGSRLLPPKGNHLGLSVLDWRDRAVPGNHDHWPGTATMFGPPTAALGHTFPALPFVGQPIPLGTGQHIRIIGIDTDKDVHPWGRNRGLARGSFCSQLTDAAGQMRAPDRNEIRVLLLHHSRVHQGFSLAMDDASRDALGVFLVEQDIPVLLCGHTHVPRLKSFRVTHQGRTIEVLEACCGTTTVMDTIPYEWRTILGTRPGRTLKINTLLVHRLLKENGAIIWHTQTYFRSPFGFEVSQRIRDKRFSVWPRP